MLVSEPSVRTLFDLDLVRRHERNAAPGDERRPEQRDGRRRHAAARAFAAERGDRARMGEEEARLLPHLGQEFVEVVGRRRAFSRADPLRRRDAGEKAVLAVVDELAFLPLLHPLDQQAELLLNLIEGLAIEVRDARLNVEDGGNRLEEIFARIVDVIDVGLRQVGVPVARRAAFDVGRVAPLSLPG